MASCIEDLPDECVLLALSHLDVRDILNFEQVSKRFCGLGRSAEVWRPRLKAEFDLGLKVGLVFNEASCCYLYPGVCCHYVSLKNPPWG